MVDKVTFVVYGQGLGDTVLNIKTEVISMHLKSIPVDAARQIKSKAAALGMSPSEYFVYLHYKNLPETNIEQEKKGNGKKKNKKK